MVEADSHLKLLPPSILDINKAFEHIDMLFIAYGSSLTQLSTLLGSDVGVLGHLWSWNDVITSCGWGWQPPQTASRIYIRHIQNVWAHWYAVNRHKVAALHSYPPYLAQILGFWVNFGVEMMSLRHSWDWQLPQTASRIYIWHIQSVADWYAVHRHKVVALHSYPPYLAQIWGLWFTYGESKWSHYVMVEADSHLKLLLASMLTIYKLFEHIDMLSIGIC